MAILETNEKKMVFGVRGMEDGDYQDVVNFLIYWCLDICCQNGLTDVLWKLTELYGGNVKYHDVAKIPGGGLVLSRSRGGGEEVGSWAPTLVNAHRLEGVVIMLHTGCAMVEIGKLECSQEDFLRNKIKTAVMRVRRALSNAGRKEVPVDGYLFTSRGLEGVELSSVTPDDLKARIGTV